MIVERGQAGSGVDASSIAIRQELEVLAHRPSLWQNVNHTMRIAKQRLHMRVVEKRWNIDASIGDTVIFCVRRCKSLQSPLGLIACPHSMHGHCCIVVDPNDVFALQVDSGFRDETPGRRGALFRPYFGHLSLPDPRHRFIAMRESQQHRRSASQTSLNAIDENACPLLINNRKRKTLAIACIDCRSSQPPNLDRHRNASSGLRSIGYLTEARSTSQDEGQEQRIFHRQPEPSGENARSTG